MLKMTSEKEEVAITLEDEPPTKKKKQSNLGSFFSVNTSVAKEVKNHTHAKVGHTSEFLFGIYWWTQKKFIKKTVEVDQ